MRIAVLGRTAGLIAAADILLKRGHTVPLVWTNRSEGFYSAKEDDFAHLAGRAGATFLDRLPANAEAFRSEVARHRCDIAISMNWLGIIPQAVLDAFPFGVLNAHAGDLPRYRGNACPNWAMLAGEQYVGLCVHLMVPELDAGPVVIRDHFDLSDRTYIADVYAWLEDVVPSHMADAAEGLFDGSLEPVAQPSDVRPLRCYPRKPEDSRIDWGQSAVNIDRLVRASSRPFAGAFATFEGQLLRIWRSEPHEPDFDYHAVPGQICFGVEGQPVVATGAGMLRLTEVTTNGGESAAALLLKSLRNRLS